QGKHLPGCASPIRAPFNIPTVVNRMETRPTTAASHPVVPMTPHPAGGFCQALSTGYRGPLGLRARPGAIVATVARAFSALAKSAEWPPLPRPPPRDHDPRRTTDDKGRACGPSPAYAPLTCPRPVLIG